VNSLNVQSVVVVVTVLSGRHVYPASSHTPSLTDTRTLKIICFSIWNIFTKSPDLIEFFKLIVESRKNVKLFCASSMTPCNAEQLTLCHVLSVCLSVCLQDCGETDVCMKIRTLVYEACICHREYYFVVKRPVPCHIVRDAVICTSGMLPEKAIEPIRLASVTFRLMKRKIQ